MHTYICMYVYMPPPTCVHAMVVWLSEDIFVEPVLSFCLYVSSEIKQVAKFAQQMPFLAEPSSWPHACCRSHAC